MASRVIRDLLDGGEPDGRLNECGPWADTVAELHEAHSIGGTGGVKAVWKTLSRRNADLIQLVSAGDDGPLAGAGEAAVRILIEGTGGAPPLLPPIDHVRQLEELEKFVHRVMGLPRRFKVRSRKRAISAAVGLCPVTCWR